MSSFDIVGMNIKAQNSLYVQNYSRIGPTTVRGDLAVENGGLSVGTDTFTTALYTTRSQSTNDVVPWLPIVLNATIAGSSSIQGY